MELLAALGDVSIAGPRAVCMAASASSWWAAPARSTAPVRWRPDSRTGGATWGATSADLERLLEVAVAFLGRRWSLAAGARPCSRPVSLPGFVTVTRVLPGGRGTLSLTAEWTSPNQHSHVLELGGFSAHFSTCYRAGFLDLKQSCVGLANPFFRVLGITPRGETMFRLTTRTVPDNFARAHRTGGIVPIDRHAGTLYRLAARDDLIVQLWAIDTRKAKPYKVSEIRG